MSEEVLKYESVREEIRDGDVLLYKGKGFISRLVRLFTKSAYSHAGLAVKWNDRLMVMEAVAKGVIITPLSRSVGHYKGDVDWYQSREPIIDNDRRKMIVVAQKELGKSFTKCGLLLVGAYIVIGKKFDENDTFVRSKKFFCSFYVAATYNAAGLDLKQDTADRFTTPDDIARSPLLKKNGVLKKDE